MQSFCSILGSPVLFISETNSPTPSHLLSHCASHLWDGIAAPFTRTNCRADPLFCPAAAGGVSTMPKRTDFISWDDYFMGIALLSAERSKDPNSQVGIGTVGWGWARRIKAWWNRICQPPSSLPVAIPPIRPFLASVLAPTVVRGLGRGTG